MHVAKLATIKPATVAQAAQGFISDLHAPSRAMISAAPIPSMESIPIFCAEDLHFIRARRSAAARIRQPAERDQS